MRNKPDLSSDSIHANKARASRRAYYRPGGSISATISKYLFVALAGMLVAGVFTGCGSSGGTSERSGSTTTRTQSEETASSGGREASALNGAGEPVQQVSEQLRPSVVQVSVEGSQQTPFGQQQAQGQGSGVIYRQDGYIVTNAHVVAGAEEVNVSFADGSTQRGRVVGADEFTEVAVIKVDRNNLPAANFAKDEPLAGQLAVAIGSPSGFESTVTSGVVSGLGREIPPELTGGERQEALVDLIQTDAAISPGSSGGALANRDGRIIGLNVAYLPPAQTGAQNLGFAIPASTVTSVADQLIQSGQAQAAYLGVSTTDLSEAVARQFDIQAESGALVAEIADGGPATRAGLQRGDVITSIEGNRIENSGDLLGALREYRPGQQVTLTVLSEGEEREVEVRLGERPGSASR